MQDTTCEGKLHNEWNNVIKDTFICILKCLEITALKIEMSTTHNRMWLSANCQQLQKFLLGMAEILKDFPFIQIAPC